jgi:hypothetical protein
MLRSFCRGFSLQLHPASDCGTARAIVSDAVCETPRGRQFVAFPQSPVGRFQLRHRNNLASRYPIVVGLNLDCLLLAAGALSLGTYLSLHFGKVRGAAALDTQYSGGNREEAAR